MTQRAFGSSSRFCPIYSYCFSLDKINPQRKVGIWSELMDLEHGRKTDQSSNCMVDVEGKGIEFMYYYTKINLKGRKNYDTCCVK